VFGALIGIFSILSPLTARFMNEIIEALLPAGDGLSINFPNPSTLDAYFQYFNDLNEIILWVILFVGVSVFIKDKSKGHMPLVMSKPINRTSYLASKYVTYIGMLLAWLIVGYVIFTYYTYVLFDETFLINGLIALSYYAVFVMFLLSIALLMSVLFKTYMIAMIMTFLGYILFSIFNMFSDYNMFKYLPGTLNHYAIDFLVIDGRVEGAVTALLVTLGLTGILLLISSVVFKKQELV
jgi:ABC-2 type transport system permease protein